MYIVIVFMQKLVKQESLQSSQLKDPKNERKQVSQPLIVQGM